MTERGRLRTHPAAACWPMMSEYELEALAESIKLTGLIHPLIAWTDGDGERWLLDGRNRLAACERAGIKPDVIDYEGDEPALYVLAANEHRRHATASQRAMAVALTANATAGNPELRKNAEFTDEVTSAAAAARGGVSVRLVEACRYVAEHDADLKNAVLAGTIKAAAAEAEARRRERERAEKSREFIKELPSRDEILQDYPDLADRLDDDDADSVRIQAEYKSRVTQACSVVENLAEAIAALTRAVKSIAENDISVAIRHKVVFNTSEAIDAVSGVVTELTKRSSHHA